jgi:uncharacterized protein YqjF (DUF2071 family)
MRVHRDGDVISYASQRRWPGRGARLRLAIRIGVPLASPSPLERFLTARWGLHATWYDGRLRYVPNAHPPWPLHHAALLGLEESLIGATGLPPPAGGPVSVLFSSGIPVRVGVPKCPASR